MVDIRVYTKDGKEGKALAVKDAEFEAEMNKPLLKQVLLAYLNNAKSHTASTKTRKEVKGSGAKPWRQKGTGRARAGSKASPIWRGGGVVFGPHPRSVEKKISKKARKIALRQSLAGKMRADECILIDDLNLETPKTKTVSSFFKSIGADGARILFITGNNAVYKSVRNIPRVNVKTAALVNALDILNNKYIVTNQADFDSLLQRAKS